MLALAVTSTAPSLAEESRPSPALSGRTFQSPSTQRLEADDGANPGMLWVEQGRAQWQQAPAQDLKSCASCHGEGTAMRGVAARYPAVDPATGALLNLEARINRCRTTHQSQPAFAFESAELLGLTTYLTYQSRGLPKQVTIDGPARPHFEEGRRFFTTRQGQLDIACVECHDGQVGRHLRGDRISQGQTDGWPAYRLDWQALGSLSRRIRACSLGVRAEVLPHGDPSYLALELYLAWRGEALPISAPGVRR